MHAKSFKLSLFQVVNSLEELVCYIQTCLICLFVCFLRQEKYVYFQHLQLTKSFKFSLFQVVNSSEELVAFKLVLFICLFFEARRVCLFYFQHLQLTKGKF